METRRGYGGTKSHRSLPARHPELAVEAGYAKAVKVTRYRCHCAKCGARWLTIFDKPPLWCKNCKKDAWWRGKVKPGRPRKAA